MSHHELPSGVVELLARNKKFEETFTGAPKLSDIMPIARQGRKAVIVLTCADPRLVPAAFLGIDPKFAPSIIRNAGGRALDAIRTIGVLQAATEAGAIVVIHHTDCGLTNLSNNDVKQFLTEQAPEQKAVIDALDIGAIEHGVEQSIKEDVQFLRNHPLVMKDTTIVGLQYDTFSGALSEVA